MLFMNALHIYSDGVCRGNPGPASIAFIIEAAKEYTKGHFKEKVGICWDVGHEIVRFRKQEFLFPQMLGKYIKEAHISRRTLFRMLSKEGNPTLENISKIVHKLCA